MSQQLFILFSVFIGLFLFGMTVMRTGLQNLAGDRVKELMVKMTDSPFKGLLVGTLITAIIQSSSAVMIITIGFVAAGIITFKQSIGVILGSNIGTCLTLEIISFDLSQLSLPLLLVGVTLLVLPKTTLFSLGCVSFGLASIFIAMDGLKELAFPLSTLPLTNTYFLLTNEYSLIGIGIGTILTAIIQSSTATTAITMGFINEDVLGLPAGIAIMLGANIGTCFTAFLASIGSTRAAKMVAFAHIWINIIGVLLFIPFINALSDFAMQLTSISNLQLAHASTIFNVVTSLAILPFVHWFSKFILHFHNGGKKL
ncbi:Na/Pi symporter [Bacillus alkalicellulosilyticus]|uniref:Na/Pi symporter n=1 Tax=Alkalihalobacterium alkalicellulosilyticum TaxID=1912214 RepID=UPI0009989B9A|nr:Na/Pi symporter [Bacillus alkalicellulosilyticus]